VPGSLRRDPAHQSRSTKNLGDVLFTNWARDRMFPRMSSFTSAAMPDLSEFSSEQAHWLGNFVLNSMFRGRFTDERQQQLAFNFERRAEAAFREYGLARERTLTYLATADSESVSVSSYAAALAQWETTLSHTWLALCLLERFGGKDRSWYDKNDHESVFLRVSHMYNTLKHTEDAIRDERMPKDSTTPVWLENDGFHRFTYQVGFAELAEVLELIGQVAAELQDPVLFAENYGEVQDVQAARNRRCQIERLRLSPT
jgi:hypothetical protein